MPQQYHAGGKVLTNVDVSVLFARTQAIKPDGTADSPTWIDATNSLGLPIPSVCDISRFVYDLVDSAFMDFLGNEFTASNAPHIGRGTFNQSLIVDLPIDQVTDTPLTIDYTDIENLIRSLVKSGRLATPHSNSLYLVLVSSMGVTQPNTTKVLGVESSGFHQAIGFPDGTRAVYGVVDATVLDIATIFLSHELAEAVTDPELSAWYDENGQEICDLCPKAGTYTIEEIQGFGAQFHGHLVTRMRTPSVDACIAPPDDANVKPGPVLKISNSRVNSSTCILGFVEGQEYTFTMSAMLDGKVMEVLYPTWNVAGGTVVKMHQNRVTVTAPATGTVCTVQASAYNDWGCALSGQASLVAISAELAAFQGFLCQLRHEILWYWRFIDPLWDPLRDFAIRPVTMAEIQALDRLTAKMGVLTPEFRRLRDSAAAHPAGANADIAAKQSRQ